MFFLSWLTARGSGTASVCLITLTDSPVGQFFCDVKAIEGSTFIVCFKCVSVLTRTSEDGLVHTQGCGFDGDDPDVGWHFVTH